MAEFGIIASVVQIADVGLRLSIKLYTFGEIVASADRSVIAISKDVSLTSGVLKELGQILDRDRETRTFSENAVQTADGVVKECLEVFREMEDILVKKLPSLGGGGGGGERAKRATVLLERLKWGYLQPKLRLLGSNLDRLKSTLLLMLNVITYARQVSEKTESPSVIAEQRSLIEDLAHSNQEYIREFERLKLGIGEPAVEQVDDASNFRAVTKFAPDGIPLQDNENTRNLGSKELTTPTRSWPPRRPLATPPNADAQKLFLNTHVQPNIEMPPVQERGIPTTDAPIGLDQEVLFKQLEHYSRLIKNLLKEVDGAHYKITLKCRLRVKGGIADLREGERRELETIWGCTALHSAEQRLDSLVGGTEESSRIKKFMAFESSTNDSPYMPLSGGKPRPFGQDAFAANIDSAHSARKVLPLNASIFQIARVSPVLRGRGRPGRNCLNDVIKEGKHGSGDHQYPEMAGPNILDAGVDESYSMPFKSDVKQKHAGDLPSDPLTFEGGPGIEDYPEAGEKGPFADLGDCLMDESGIVNDKHGNGVGVLVDGNLKGLVGRNVKEDGNIVDEHGNVVGHAEPYEEAKQEIVDKSSLEDKVVNGLGQVVDEHGTILGRISEGDIKELSGKKVDGKGQIWENGQKVIGQAELLPGIELPKLLPKKSTSLSGLPPALALPGMPARSPLAFGMSEKRIQKHPDTYQCTLCPKKFTRAHNLSSHLQSHLQTNTGERPFPCIVCGESFARQHDLKWHQAVHSEEEYQADKRDHGSNADATPKPDPDPGSSSRLNDSLEWPLDRVLKWLAANGFSDDWQRTFKSLEMSGAEFLDLGRGNGGSGNIGTMHQSVYPRLAKVCSESGTGWDQDRERREGMRMRRAIRKMIRGAENSDIALGDPVVDWWSSYSLAPSLRVSRPVAACQRCRAAKIKCDGKLPACTACEETMQSAECSMTDEQRRVTSSPADDNGEHWSVSPTEHSIQRTSMPSRVRPIGSWTPSRRYSSKFKPSGLMKPGQTQSPDYMYDATPSINGSRLPAPPEDPSSPNHPHLPTYAQNILTSAQTEAKSDRIWAAEVKAAYDDGDSEEYHSEDLRAPPRARRDVVEAQKDARGAEGEDVITQDNIELGPYGDTDTESDLKEYTTSSTYDPILDGDEEEDDDLIGLGGAAPPRGMHASPFSEGEQGDSKLADMEVVDRLLALWTTVKPL